MAEEAAKSEEVATAAATASADEAAFAADGLRKTSQWIAAAFAGIPSLAVISALVRAPGDAGFEEGQLIIGVALAAVGAFIGIHAFARVMAPIGLSDKSISDDVMNHVPEARFATYTELREALEVARDDVAVSRPVASDAAGRAAAAEARAVQAEAAAKLLDDLVGDNDPPDPVKKAEAVAARQQARTLREEAGAAAAKSAVAAKELELDDQAYAALEALRRGAYGLQAGETVRTRFDDANWWSFLAVALVAAGVILLALAPEPKAEEPAAPTTSLVTLSLSEEGKTALGCEADNVDALRIGGEDEAPTVVVLPGGPCPVRTVKFTTAEPTPLGTLEEATVLEVK